MCIRDRSKRIGSSLNFIVKPISSLEFSNSRNFSFVKFATINSLLRFKISTLDLACINLTVYTNSQ